MKRGFLNTKKAVSAIETTSAPAPVVSKAFSLPYGVVKNAGVPQGYTPTHVGMVESDANHIDDEHAERRILFTTQPLRNVDLTLADFPDGWTECMIFSDVKRKIVQTPGFPKSPQKPKGGKPYVIKETADKGLGMFAIRNIEAGELICDERPFMIGPRSLYSPVLQFDPTKMTQEQFVQMAMVDEERNLEILVARMDPEKKRAFMSLANSHLHDGSGPILGIVRTNAFGVTEEMLGSDTDLDKHLGGYGAVLDDISRMNHSCSPNTTHFFKVVSFSTSLYAVREIASGEEITTSYVGLTDPASIRQKNLAPYGFQCTCTSCLNPSVSDPKRIALRLEDIEPISVPLGKKFKPTDRLDEWIQPALRTLQFHKDEGVQALLSCRSLLYQIFRAYMCVGDAETAAKYGKEFWATIRASEYELGLKQGKAKYCDIEAIKKSREFGYGRVVMLYGFPIKITL